MSLTNGDLPFEDYDDDADFEDDEVVRRYGLMTQKENEEAHADPEFVEFFYGPAGLNMLAYMAKREEGMQWVYDPIGLPVAPPVARRVAP
jgi:hypothetical protein